MADVLNAACQAGKECLEAALDYLNNFGWPVLWLCPPDHIGVGKTHGKSCSSPGKSPFGLWKDFQSRLPTADEITAKHRDLPNGNVGIALGGPAQLCRLDIEGQAGEERLKELSRDDLPPTPSFRSGRADGTGRGLLYRIPDGLTWRTKIEGLGLGAELRIQGLGAQTVLPPSRHKDGGRYSWIIGLAPWDVKLSVAPEWLIRLMDEYTKGKKGGREPAEVLEDGEMISEGGRNSTLASLAGTMRRRGFPQEAIAAALHVLNDSRCDPPLEESEVDGIAERIARYKPAEVISVRHVPSEGQAQEQATQPPDDGMHLLDLSKVKPEPVMWLWEPWIPLGCLSVLDGDPGLGKSTFTLDLSARVSRGWAMPPEGGYPDEAIDPAGVLLLSAEDDPARTIRPRLDAAGADCRRITFFEGVHENKQLRPPILPYDLDKVLKQATEEKIRLVVIDPLAAFLSSEFDAHRDQDIRRCLCHMDLTARKYDIAILMLRHLNKLNGGPALYRGGGSIGITGAARASLVLGRDPDNPFIRVLAMNKTNLGPMPQSVSFRITEVGHNVTRLEWLGETSLKPEDILWHAQGKSPSRTDDELKEAKNWLADELSTGAKAAEYLKEQSEKFDISWRTLERAKREMKVRSFKQGTSWLWELP